MTPTARSASYRHRFEGPAWRRVLVEGLRRLPLGVQRASMPLWAGLFFAALPSLRADLRRGLALVAGPLDGDGPLATARALRLFRGYCQALANAYLLGLGRELPLEPRFVGADRLHALRAAGRGAILATGHLGAWQLGAALVERAGLGPITLAMAAEPTEALRRFEAPMRARTRIVYTGGSALSSLPLLGALRRGELVALQLDRSASETCLEVPFFGRLAPFPRGPAALARAAEVPIVPTFILARGGPRYEVRVEAPIEVARTADPEADVAVATARLVAVYEGRVRADPLQWYNFGDPRAAGP